MKLNTIKSILFIILRLFKSFILTTFLLLTFGSFTIVNCRKKKEVPPPFLCGVPLNFVNKKNLDTTKIYPMIVYEERFIWEMDKLELYVFFADVTDKNLIEKTIIAANKWFPGKNIFKITSDKYISDIRVSFRCPYDGYKSLIGTEAKGKNITLWLNELDKQSDSIFNRVVQHEFGHALGLYHEIMNPSLNIVWDSSVVYDYYSKHNKWTNEEVNKNVLTKSKTTTYTKFDPSSIMNYFIPLSFTKNKITITQPRTISATDLSGIKNIYKL